MSHREGRGERSRPSKSPVRGRSDFGPRRVASRNNNSSNSNISSTGDYVDSTEALVEGGSRVTARRGGERRPRNREDPDRPRRRTSLSSNNSSHSQQHSPAPSATSASASALQERDYREHRHRERERDRPRRAATTLSGQRTARHASDPNLVDNAVDASSTYSGRSGRGSVGTSSSATSINHEDELERIRENRARRLRMANAAAGNSGNAGNATAAGAAGEGERSKSPVPGKSREQRRREGRAAAGAAPPTKNRSNPLISRRELEEAGLVRKDRDRRTRPRATGDGDTVPRRNQSEHVFTNIRNRSGRSRRDLSPKNDSTSTSEDFGMYNSRVRRERERGSDEDSSAYARATRLAEHGDEDSSSYARSRRERDRERDRNRHATSDDDPAASTLSRIRRERERERAAAAAATEQEEDSSRNSSSRAEIGSRRPRHASANDLEAYSASGATTNVNASVRSPVSLGSHGSRRTATTAESTERPLSQRSALSAATGGSEESRASRERPQPRRRAPQRSKSADNDLLAMDQKNRGKVATTAATATAAAEDNNSGRESRGLERDEKPSERSRSTDLSTRLRERREARLAGREIKSGGGDGPERRLSRRRSNDETLTEMGNATKPQPPHTSSSPGKHPSTAARIRSPTTTTKKADSDIDKLRLNRASSGEANQCSVKVAIVSAVDLPQNVIPNMPLCPVVKVGFVKIPEGEGSVRDQVFSKLGEATVEELPASRTRSTTSKIMSKRDNGSLDFSQELRWDHVEQPGKVALLIELAARAAQTPKNMAISPPLSNQLQAFEITRPAKPEKNSRIRQSVAASPYASPVGSPRAGAAPVASAAAGGADSNDQEEGGGFRALWRKATNRKAAELEAAQAAAAVARRLVEQANEAAANSGADPAETSPAAPEATSTVTEYTTIPQSDYDVALRQQENDNEETKDLTGDLLLGNLVIPFNQLALEHAITGLARLEKWYPIEMTHASDDETARRKNPSVLLEIVVGQEEALDEKERELRQPNKDGTAAAPTTVEESKLEASVSNRGGGRSDVQGGNSKETKDPVLEPGVVDFLAVVGCKDIGNQKEDNGLKGWVTSTPESVILEQFPPNNEFHHKNGRNALLPEMVQWFCFPEGAKLWRGVGPPTAADLNLKPAVSGTSAGPSEATSLPAFDECLQCTTSFAWFAIASNSDEYGSKLAKTYGVTIRFYVPAPRGVDSTQEDFGQILPVAPDTDLTKRLWVPVGICLTTSLPIVGILESILLRLCQALVDKVGANSEGMLGELEDIHLALQRLILDFKKPISGAVNCSMPFLEGDRYLVSLPPPTGLPPLPHGKAIISTCRLLGADGLNYLLAAVLTECKVLYHSNNIADITMVAEVVTALIYPFAWSLPYIPILPLGMVEFVEAPLSYMLGIPSCNVGLIDPFALEDVVVIDLNRTASGSISVPKPARGGSGAAKNPTTLPASVANSISQAVERLFLAEEAAADDFGVSYESEAILPRLETESLAEREFRVAVAVEICGLLRGYQECLGPVFNRDKFIKISPAVYEERRDPLRNSTTHASNRTSNGKILSARSKRFLSMLVNTQNFQQFLECLELDDTAFFHEIMEMWEDSNSAEKTGPRVQENNPKSEKSLAQLVRSLQKAEDVIPTFVIDKKEDHDFDLLYFNEDESYVNIDILDELNYEPGLRSNKTPSFTPSMLAPVEREEAGAPGEDGGGGGVSLEHLAILEKNPWEYKRMFEIPHEQQETNDETVADRKIPLKEAIGERRYRSWQVAQAQKAGEDLGITLTQSLQATKKGAALDLTSLISSAAKGDIADHVATHTTVSPRRASNLAPEQQRVADAKDRDVLRRCLDRANRLTNNLPQDDNVNPFVENGRDLIAESEKALRNPSAQSFLLTILAQRSRLENQRMRTTRRNSTTMTSVSRLESLAFDCLVRLSSAMLDSCMEYEEYEAAYRLLTLTAGFITVVETSDDAAAGDHGESNQPNVVSMTSRLGLHPVFGEMATWASVMNLHLTDRHSGKRTGSRLSDDGTETDDEDEDEVEYEAAVATLYEMVGYGIPGEELSRFAMRMSEEKGWFNDDRGRQLLVLARRIAVRRDQSDAGQMPGKTAALDMMVSSNDTKLQLGSSLSDLTRSEKEGKWLELGWCHPAAPSTKASFGLKQTERAEDTFMKRSPVTALACFGSSVVVSGGLDGGVFVAYSIEESTGERVIPEVRGLHLDWGSAIRAGTGSSSDGEYGVGAVSCLAASWSPGQSATGTSTTKDTKDSVGATVSPPMAEGSRVVAGTTAGDLRVWSVKDVYDSLLAMKHGDDGEHEHKSAVGGGNSQTRLKFSLRGRALSGHRGGVTCIDVPSQVYRPDSLVTGGADGLIKLWSLRAPTSGRRSSASAAGTGHTEREMQQRGRGGDALNVLSGHDGRILCVKTAWHGDRLLSGGADRTLRVWDLSASGKSLHTLSGHGGWVTQIQYWGPNTIVSGSTDRSLALWDSRVKGSPLFVLRHHHSPISDFMVGSRTDPLMVSAASDGTIATWDFRALSDAPKHTKSVIANGIVEANVIRKPRASMMHESKGNKAPRHASGQTFLARGPINAMKSVLSVGSDAIVRDWDVTSGSLEGEYSTGHCDAVSSFQSLTSNSGVAGEDMNYRTGSSAGVISSSWDGTIRMRKLEK